jgi:2-(1,2-epoxy-1,2-dihydrophenyl)acetyl-CoA isomerase
MASLVETGPVTLAVDGGLARVRLCRPEANNALDHDVAFGLHRAVSALAGRDGVRAVLVDAEGRHFTVGGDLFHLDGAGDDLPAELQRMISLYHGALAQLARLDAPVVCAVQGAAAGGGLGLLWAADVVFAADDLKLASGFAKLGLAGDGGSSWAVPRLAGPRRAWEFLVDGRVLDAREALEWGLVSEVVAAGQLADVAEAYARRLASGPTRAYGHLRRLMRESPQRTWPEHLDAERQVMNDLAHTADAREGIAAFTGRRRAEFRGA